MILCRVVVPRSCGLARPTRCSSGFGCSASRAQRARVRFGRRVGMRDVARRSTRAHPLVWWSEHRTVLPFYCRRKMRVTNSRRAASARWFLVPTSCNQAIDFEHCAARAEYLGTPASLLSGGLRGCLDFCADQSVQGGRQRGGWSERMRIPSALGLLWAVCLDSRKRCRAGGAARRIVDARVL